MRKDLPRVSRTTHLRSIYERTSLLLGPIQLPAKIALSRIQTLNCRLKLLLMQRFVCPTMTDSAADTVATHAASLLLAPFNFS